MHSENHVRLYGRPSQRNAGREKKDNGRAFVQLGCGGVGVDRDTYWNDTHTSNASRMVRGHGCGLFVVDELAFCGDFASALLGGVKETGLFCIQILLLPDV